MAKNKRMEDVYAPVPLDAAWVAAVLSDPDVRAAYDALEDEYAALDALLKTRHEIHILPYHF